MSLFPKKVEYPFKFIESLQDVLDETLQSAGLLRCQCKMTKMYMHD